MSLFNWLMENRTKEELAKALAAEAHKNAKLEDEVHALNHTLFWMKAVDVTPELRPMLPFLRDEAPYTGASLVVDTVQEDSILTYEEFSVKYRAARLTAGDHYHVGEMQRSWIAYCRDPSGHFISKET